MELNENGIKRLLDEGFLPRLDAPNINLKQDEFCICAIKGNTMKEKNSY